MTEDNLRVKKEVDLNAHSQDPIRRYDFGKANDSVRAYKGGKFKNTCMLPLVRSGIFCRPFQQIFVMRYI